MNKEKCALSILSLLTITIIVMPIAVTVYCYRYMQHDVYTNSVQIIKEYYSSDCSNGEAILVACCGQVALCITLFIEIMLTKNNASVRSNALYRFVSIYNRAIGVLFGVYYLVMMIMVQIEFFSRISKYSLRFPSSRNYYIMCVLFITNGYIVIFYVVIAVLGFSIRRC